MKKDKDNEYTKEVVEELLKTLDAELVVKILKKCPSTAGLARVLNSTMDNLDRMCDTAERLLCDEMIRAILGQKYLEYERRIDDKDSDDDGDKYTVAINKKIVPESFEIVEVHGVKGFYVEGKFIVIAE